MDKELKKAFDDGGTLISFRSGPDNTLVMRTDFKQDGCVVTICTFYSLDLQLVMRLAAHKNLQSIIKVVTLSTDGFNDWKKGLSIITKYKRAGDKYPTLKIRKIEDDGKR